MLYLNKMENVDTGLPLFLYSFFNIERKGRFLIIRITPYSGYLTICYKLYAMLMTYKLFLCIINSDNFRNPYICWIV